MTENTREIIDFYDHIKWRQRDLFKIIMESKRKGWVTKTLEKDLAHVENLLKKTEKEMKNDQAREKRKRLTS